MVDVCPVGALTSTRFRFAERVFNLDKKPSICAGCDAGCNITIEHRRGKIRRYKPRTNPEVNDYWMCDDGRASWEKYRDRPRLTSPRVRGKATTWKEALDAVYQRVRSRSAEGATAILGSGQLTTEEAYLFAQLADQIGTPHRSVAVDPFPERRIPNPQGGVFGREAAPNRRGAELAGLATRPGSFTAEELLNGDGASRCATLVVTDGDFGAAAWDDAAVARLREASFLIVFSWADSPLAQAADIALPIATHAEKDGSFVNSQRRVQRFRAAFPAPGQVRGGVEVLSDLLSRFDPAWGGLSPAEVFDRFAGAEPEMGGLRFGNVPPMGSALPPAAPEAQAVGAEG